MTERDRGIPNRKPLVMIETGSASMLPDIIMSPRLLPDAKERDYFLVVDNKFGNTQFPMLVKRFQMAGLRRPKGIVVPEGEEAKSFKTYENVINLLEQSRANRSAVLVAVGGGTVGDLTGHVAATYKRGVPYIQVPTTLLSQVDSSIGGKVGLNTEGGKNTVGQFYDPIAIVIDPSFLRTLPFHEMRSGWAEVVKYSVINPNFVEKIDFNKMFGEDLEVDLDYIQDLIKFCVKTKQAIVEKDPYDDGIRQVLNFGHTIGHGIERDAKISHGDAVAIGMVLESGLAVRRGLMSEALRDDMIFLLVDAGLPIVPPQSVRPDRAVAYMENDKKNDGSINIVVPGEGSNKYSKFSVSADELRELLRPPLRTS